MSSQLVIHGHLYQPPREDPWLDEVLPEGSAAPARNWNERIIDESYGPLAFARRLDHEGRIQEIMNCYDWISFNVGPTLMSWLARHRKDVYERMLAGDRASAERLGHGNAVAQVAHHVVLPLATPLDKELQVVWGKADFEYRFGHHPEGMWLAEAAVDTLTLEALAAEGIAFTILAPSQAKAVRPLQSGPGEWTNVSEGGLDISRPYLVKLPSGKSISIFFYDGPISQAVAFERLLADGEAFWSRIVSYMPAGVRALATDGETYGHHFQFGEMALAYVLDQGRQARDGIVLTNFAANLAANPPTHEVKLHQSSAWSCAHGVERWRSDCGCSDDGPSEWNQKWRGPLRHALNQAKARIDDHFFKRGQDLFLHPRTALRAYGQVLCGAITPGEYAKVHCNYWLTPQELETAWTLLAMQRWAVSSFASCAWFFADIDRIEPVNAMSMMLRAMELGVKTGMADPTEEVLGTLDQAHSNLPASGTGADIFRAQVLPRRESTESLVLQAALQLWARDQLPDKGKMQTASWTGVEVDLEGQSGPDAYVATVRYALGSGRERCRVKLVRHEPLAPASWEVRLEDGRICHGRDLPWNKLQDSFTLWVERVSLQSMEEQAKASEAGPGAFAKLQDIQQAQTADPSWMSLLLGLAWSQLTGKTQASGPNEALLAYLGTGLASHPARAHLCAAVDDLVLNLLRTGKSAQAVVCLTRARQMDLKLVLTKAQNYAWTHQDQCRGVADLWKILGFAG